MNVPFREKDVSRDREAAQEMINLTGQMGVPVIVIDGEPVVGFDRQRIQELVTASKQSAGKQPVKFGLKIGDAQKVTPPSGAVALTGAIIGEVAPGALGERAGLKAGDIVTRINRQFVTNASDMEHALTGIKAGDVVTIEFMRGGQPRKSEIVV
jgi:type II secretory pathway component PulC